ncbi:hypothetical protein IE4872_CH01992 [Rhizobium gallicum]|uniref:HNH endonuclease n=1 Tax=Rhizobium gallicum TaxID=56730 RepID=A0A1L5NIC6_9HYPH|nr:HNH endonuclease signature motif containing protein [Rhizobium gallicum]APO67609.1 hypothetical protein IE4872_CH01992 [Rhizobium gallicum]
MTEATIVDHIKAHKESGEFFFDPSNMQSLCKHHHDSAKKMIDHGKMVVTYGLDGYPIEMGKASPSSSVSQARTWGYGETGVRAR